MDMIKVEQHKSRAYHLRDQKILDAVMITAFPQNLAIPQNPAAYFS